MSILKVELTFCLSQQQILIPLRLNAPCSVRTALEYAMDSNDLPVMDIEQLSLGIFSQRVTLSTLLREGDRIEIYRPLMIDPKQARRLRALGSVDNSTRLAKKR